MSEVLGVKRRETLAIVDGLADNEHRGEGEMVVVDNLREVFQDSSIDLLVWPCEMIAGSHGCILWVLHKQFTLHIIDDGGRKEDAHRTLAASQKMELFLFWHGGAPFTTSEDDGLTTLRDGKLAL